MRAGPQLTIVDGSAVSWQAFGDQHGRPVVWCHGGLSSRLDAGLADEGAARVGVRLVSIDRPGIGDSEPRSAPTLPRWPRTVAGLMDRLGYGAFGVVGWSAGAPYALACAHALGARITATATVAGVGPLHTRERRRELGLLIDRALLRVAPRSVPAARAIVGVASAAPDRLLRRSLLRAALPHERTLLGTLDERQLVGFVREAVRRGTAGIATDYATIGQPWGFAPDAVRAPVTVWHGSADPLVPLSQGHLLAELLPRGTLRVVPGAGHFLPLTHAAEILGTL